MGLVVRIGAQIQQCLAGSQVAVGGDNTPEAGVKAAIGIEPHNAVVGACACATGGLGGGVTRDQDLAVRLRHDGLGLVVRVAAQVQQQRLAANR